MGTESQAAPVHFVGAGPGAPDLMTLRGRRLIEEADLIIYAGSLINPALLDWRKPGCRVMNSAKMTLEEIVGAMEEAARRGEQVVRLQTGDPSLYGAVGEQMRALEKRGIAYDSTPGVSSFLGAAAALNLEYTVPERSQTVILSRIGGKTPVPERESVESLAAHGCTMVYFLSAGQMGELARRLIKGGYSPDTPAALVYKATWPEERTWVCTLGTLEKTAGDNHITKTALVIVGEAAGRAKAPGIIREKGEAAESEPVGSDRGASTRSKLYDPSFETEFRGKKQ